LYAINGVGNKINKLHYQKYNLFTRSYQKLQPPVLLPPALEEGVQEVPATLVVYQK
jgi:hypothetical protein